MERPRRARALRLGSLGLRKNSITANMAKRKRKHAARLHAQAALHGPAEKRASNGFLGELRGADNTAETGISSRIDWEGSQGLKRDFGRSKLHRVKKIVRVPQWFNEDSAAEHKAVQTGSHPGPCPSFFFMRAPDFSLYAHPGIAYIKNFPVCIDRGP